jgi:predicted amidohydrolase
LPPPYLTRAELHQQPIPLRPIDLAEFARIYPGARARFTVLIDEKGNVDAIDVHGGSDRAFAEAFRSFLGKTRFVPGKMGGRPVKSQIIVETSLPEARRAAAPQGDSMAPMRLP